MNIVCFGAHPDDPEFYAGGTLALWARQGHHVVAVSVTRGDIGHHVLGKEELAQVRHRETQAAARIGGYEAEVLGFGDGHLLPTLEVREAIVRTIRKHEADIVLTHRPYDYHPDHRYAAMAVQDAAYMVMVPHFCPDTPALHHNPYFFYMADQFTKPVPFRADVSIDITPVIGLKMNLLDAMPSQVYEWLPWIEGELHKVPEDPAARLTWLLDRWGPMFTKFAAAHRSTLQEWYAAHGNDVLYAESFEICEYGRQPDRDTLSRLFPLGLT